MPTAIERRLVWLEERRPRRRTDVERMTDHELRAALIESLRAGLADPDSSDEWVRRAKVLLALPWGSPTREWSVDQMRAFCDEVHRASKYETFDVRR